MRILYTLFLTAMVAIAMERCRGEYLLVAVEEDDDLRKPKNDDIRNDDDDLRKSKTDDLRAEKSRGCVDCGHIRGICCKFDNGTERCALRENCPTYGKDNRVTKLRNEAKKCFGPSRFCVGRCNRGFYCDIKDINHWGCIPGICRKVKDSTEEQFNTNPGIECCNYYNVDPICFASCQQLDIPVNSTEESSRFIPCIEMSSVIRRCRNGWSEWKLDKCCKKYGVSNKCRPLMCYGECKNKPWVLVGEGTGDQECDQHIEDVSRCCGTN